MYTLRVNPVAFRSQEQSNLIQVWLVSVHPNYVLIRLVLCSLEIADFTLRLIMLWNNDLAF